MCIYNTLHPNHGELYLVPSELIPIMMAGSWHSLLIYKKFVVPSIEILRYSRFFKRIGNTILLGETFINISLRNGMLYAIKLTTKMEYKYYLC